MTEPSSLRELLARCADALAQGTAIAELDPDVQSLLVDLEYLPPSGVAPPPGEAANWAALLRAAARFRRIFELSAPDAPGLTFFGAEADPSSVGASNTGDAIAGVSGVGLSRRTAFQSCVGEGVEYLSQFESDEDEITTGGDAAAAIRDAAPLYRRFAAVSCRIDAGHGLGFGHADRGRRTMPSSGRHLPAARS